MKKMYSTVLLLAIAAYSCSKDAHGPARTSYIEATVNGVRVEFDSLTTAWIDPSYQLIEMSGYKGVPRTDTLLFSGGYQQTLSDFILLRLGYAYGGAFTTGNFSDTALLRKDVALLYYGKYTNFTNQPNYDIYVDLPFSSVTATVTSVADSVIQGTFQGTTYGETNTSQQVVIKDGKFRVKMVP